MITYDSKKMYELIDKELQMIASHKGYIKTFYEYLPKAFGNICTDYRKGNGLIRFIWDGKEGWYLLQIYSDEKKKFKTIFNKSKSQLISELLIKSEEVEELNEIEIINKFMRITNNV